MRTSAAGVRQQRVPAAEASPRQAPERRRSAGGEDEQSLATLLALRCPDVFMLHGRAAPLSRTTIEHIAIAPSGVHVIGSRRYRGKIEVTNPLIGTQKLKIRGLNRTSLIGDLERQVAHVKAALEGFDEAVPVHGCLCFLAPEGRFAGVGLPILRTPKIRGYPLYHAKRLARRLKRAGTIDDERAATLQRELAERLPPAPHPLPVHD